MKITATPEVLAALDEMERAETKKYRAKRTGEEKELARLRAIDEIRLARQVELNRCATEIFEWRAAFVELPETKRIWPALGGKARLPLFFARFWRGEPVPASDRTACAGLVFEAWLPSFGLPPFWYEERYKGHVSAEARLTSPRELVDRLHPDFLAAAHAHLTGPEMWKFILQELQRYSKR